MIQSDFGETNNQAIARMDSAPSYISETPTPTTAGILARGR
ncbi:hypothetical protein HMPREF0880_02586 [Yokenella regensburgei ATCC 43003]|nr:hypothetical protein HMPREF0880_02586 [Yokenella regensburgei ATCC 43003]